MNTFEITVQREAGDGWPVVVEQSRPGVFLPVRGEGILQLDRVELRSQTTARDYGTVLGRALFRDAVARAFDRARAESEDRLHVLLFVEAPDLRSLHWERLCAPLDLGDHWDFLARDQRVPFSLYLPSLTDRRFPAIGRRDLRALVVAASPPGLERYGLAHFDVETAVGSVRAALGRIPCDVLGTVGNAVGPPTLDAVCERITAERYTLLHVVCHGQLAGDETVLYLAKADGQVDPVAGTRMLERLRGLRGARGLPHFAFLATCESASPKVEGALGGLAQRLVRELGMPAVLAMTEPVSLETAQALTARFYHYLWEHGDLDRALVEACAGLAERADVVVPALYSRLGGRPLFSDALDRELTDAEIEFGLGRVRELLGERAPVLRSEFSGREAPLRGTLGRDPAALSGAARQEREQALENVNTLCEDALELSFNAVALGQEPPPYDARCPFRGLYPFRPDDREFFFGREALVETLRQRLAEHPFLAVLGPSGCGKSSLVLAGLLPALQSREPGLEIAYLTPGATPLAQLKASLPGPDGSPFVLVVDQFEELFTLCPDEAERRAFLGRLLELAARTRVVLTMRADFWGACAPYPALKEAMRARQELIAAMDAAELRRAIELQARSVGLRLEADLSHTILDDVQGEPGAMPLLQHALLELWKRRHGRWLRAAEYWAIGGVRQAIARTADDVYVTLSPEERERVRQIFARLTRLGEEAVPGEERRDTRQRVRLDELVPAGSDPAATRALVRRLADARLVVTGLNRATEREEVEVAHEALIRYWPRLRGWLDEDRSSLRLRAGIREAALEWEAGQRDEALLVHRGNRLVDAVALSGQPRFELNASEQAYVGACVALREREHAEAEAQRQRELMAARERAELAEARRIAEAEARREAEQRAAEQVRAARRERRLRGVAVAVAVAMVVAAGGAALAAGFALAERDRADQQRRIALARQLVAQSLARLDDRPDLAILLGLHANRINDTVETRGSLLHGFAANPGLTTYLRQHQSSINSVAFSPDGTRLASSGDDGSLVVWDVAVRRSLGGLPPAVESGALNSLAFSPDGATLAIASSDTTILLWDVAAGQLRGRLEAGHTRPVRSVAFSPDGRTLASGSDDANVRLWEVAAGRPIDPPLVGHIGTVHSVAFSRDGTLASAGADRTIRLWDVAARRPLPDLPVRHTEEVNGLAFSPDGATLASGSGDRTVILWDVATRWPIDPPLEGHTGGVWSVAFNADGSTLASGGGDNTIVLWDVAARRPLGPRLTGHTSRVWSVAFGPDRETLASGGRDSTVILWDVGARRPITGHDLWVTGVAFSPDGRTLASASWDSTVRLWDVATRRPLHPPLREHRGWVTSVAFSPDGTLLASGSWDNQVILWDVATGRQRGPPLADHPAQVTSVAFSPDGTTLAAGVGDNTVVLWDVATRQRRGEPLKGHTESVLSVAFSSNGATLASGSADWQVRLWDVADSRRPDPAVLEGHTGWVSGVAFSPDGTTLASASYDNTVILWDVARRERRGSPLLGHADSISSVAFSPDGTTLASGSWDKTIILWDVASRQALGPPLTHHTDWVSSVAFSPDGGTLASASRDGTVMPRSVGVDAWRARACDVVARNLTGEEWNQLVGEGVPYTRTCPELPPGEGAPSDVPAARR